MEITLRISRNDYLVRPIISRSPDEQLGSKYLHNRNFKPENQHSKECMCRLRNSDMWLPRKCDYWTDTQTDAGKIIPICHFALQATQKWSKQWQPSKKCTCRLQNRDMRDYQESVTTGQTDAGQSDPDPYVPL